jgi:hypothetical protein
MRVLSNSGRFRVASQQFKLFVLFAIAFCAAAQYFRIVASPDPSSFFVDIKRVYERRYSTIRIEEAGEFIARSGNSKDESKASSNPSICVGIATVQRDDAKYFNLLVGSPLEGLSDAERRDILLLPLIANIDPGAHYAFNESWLFDLTDEVLTYENVLKKDKARMRSQETPKGHEKKALFDYSYMLRKCLDSGTPYILMLEDDTIAADGWYRRTKTAVAEMKSCPEYPSSIYLRLFYNTRLQAWNSEFWPH